MAMDAIYKERGSDWSHQVSVVATTQWLQRDHTLPLLVKGVACETACGSGLQVVKVKTVKRLHYLAWHSYRSFVNKGTIVVMISLAMHAVHMALVGSYIYIVG